MRWQHDLPRILSECRFCRPEEERRHRRLMESSRRKALFIRKTVHEAVRERAPIAGYVVTGWRDTPIATAGFVDDWMDARFSPEETLPWNGADCLFLIPTRRPPFHKGGNRPGWLDPFMFREGNAFGRSGFPFRSTEYTTPSSVDYSDVQVPNARWHEAHTFTCFAYPTFSEENMHEIAAALVKVIKAFAKKRAHA